MKNAGNRKELSETVKAVTGQTSGDETAEMAIQNVREYLENVIAFIPEHVYWKDKNGFYLGCNDQQAKALGLSSRKEIVGKTDFDLAWSEQAAAIVANDQEVMRTGIPKIAEESGHLADSSWIVAITHKVPLKNKSGEIIGVLGISTNITERKKMEEELKEAKEKAETASRVKTDFLENMRHDIRTPFSGILSLAAHLESIENDPEKKELLLDVVQSAKVLLDYFNNILDFSNIETGLPILEKKLNIKNLAHDLVKMELPAAKSKNLKLTAEIAENIPDIIIGDEFRINRILINLVSNAIKFTESGHVKLKVETIFKKGREAVLKVSVEDTGIGIPKDKQDFVYEKFSRLTSSSQGRYLGSGLGLRVVKKFVDDLGGDIEIKSDLGKGTVFTCLIPVKVPLI